MTEDDLSVNWLEYFGPDEMEVNVDNVRKVFQKKSYSLRPNGRFAVLRVGVAKTAIEATYGNLLQFEHEPWDDDPSHSAIRGYSQGDFMIATELAALASEQGLYEAIV